MSTLFFRQWRILVLLVLLVVTTGAAALMTIGRQEDPSITGLFATVITPYPGAEPARVEALVTEKIEEELREIAEIDEITSTSRTGISVVAIDLSQFISDEEIDRAWSEIRDALSDAARQFPAGVPEPEFDNDRTGAFTAISAITARDGVNVPPSLPRRWAEDLRDRLRGLPNTKIVRLYGAATEEVLVTVDPNRLAALGLTVDAVAAAIRAADSKVSAGRLRGASQDLVLEVAGEIEALDRVRSIPVIADPDGQTVRVADLATVSKASLRPQETHALSRGRPAVLVAAQMENDRQVDTWMALVKRTIAEFEAELPGGLRHELIFDQSAYTSARLEGLLGNIAIGVGLVILVLFLTLGWRAALIVAAVLPLSALISLLVLQRLGVPIQQMSVTGLIVALGLLVDAAIVMVDDIRKRLEVGNPRLEAVRAAVRRLSVPLLASTVTTVLSFVPMALLPGPAGDFVGSIAISVIVMLCASLLLAVTVTPALAGHLLPKDAERAGWWRNGIGAGAMGRLFARTVGLGLRHPRVGLLAGLALPLIGFASFPTLTAQFFPGVDRDQLYVQVFLPEGTAVTRTRAVAEHADGLLRREPDVRRVEWVVGESAPAFYYNMVSDQDGAASFAEALVTTTSAEATKRLLTDLQALFDREIPEALVLVRGLVQGPPVDAPVALRVVGPDLATLKRLGEEFRSRMAAIPGIVHTRADLMGGAPKLVFVPDEDEARRVGLSLDEIARQLETLTEGATGGSLVEGSEELPVRVRVPDGLRDAPEKIDALPILPADGRAVALAGEWPGIPLGRLGHWELRPSDSPIARKDGERKNTLKAWVQEGVLPEEALKQLLAALERDPVALPVGYRLEIGGDADARAETVRNLMGTLPLVIAGLVATIVLTFLSFRLSGITLLVSGLSMGLSFLALAVFGYPFGIQSLIGAIGAMGVSINAAIVIQTALRRDAAAMRGEADAVLAVVTGQTRHIVSTTVTTVGGFLPLILDGGGFWPPFAMAVAGGVALSTIISFFVVPPLFLLANRMRAPRLDDELGRNKQTVPA